MSEYETKKFNKFDVENPGDIFSGDRVYNVPYSQRNFSWNTELDDKNKNQVGKFWNALLRQWKSFSEFSSHIEEQRADLEAKKLAGSLTPAEIEAKEEELAKFTEPHEFAEYFIGPLVFSQTKTRRPDITGKRVLNVVDGQQRLSVLTMIFAICRDIYFEYKEEEYIQSTSPRLTFTVIQDDLFKLLEISSSRTERTSNGLWRFQPNVQDAHLFNKIILPWSVKQHEESNNNLPKSFREENPAARCLRLEEKIKYFENEIEDSNLHKYDGKESNVKIIRTYLTLYQFIWNAIITDFTIDTDKQDAIMTEIRDAANSEADFEIHDDPTSFHLSDNFFTNDNHESTFIKIGLDVLRKQKYDAFKKEYENIDWGDKLTVKIKEQFRKDKKLEESDPIPPEKFETWLKERYLRKKRNGLQYLGTTLTRDDNFNKIFDELKEKKYIKLRNDKALEQFENGHLDEFIRYMVTELLFGVRITLKDTKTANLVFKTLNYDGEPLTTADLIKNHILDYIPTETDKEKLAKVWDEILTKVKSKDGFLELSLKSRGVIKNGVWEFDKFKVADLKSTVKVTDDTLYDILEQKITKKADAENYVAELEEDVQIYQKLHNSEKRIREDPALFPDHKDINPALDVLDNLNYVYAHIPIMAAWRHWGELNDKTWTNTDPSFVVLVKILAIWLFRFKTIRVISGAASTIDTIMTKITKYIVNNDSDDATKLKVLENIQKFLLQYDDDGDFLISLKNKAIVRPRSAHVDVTILSQITKHLDPAQRELIGFDALEREHVLPDKSRLWDADDFVSDWSDLAKEDGTPNQKRMFDLVEFFDKPEIPMADHKFEDMVHKLGNLSILQKGMNIKISNLPFLEKKFHFEKSTKNDLKDNGCTLEGDSTATPPISACAYYSDTGKSQIEYPNRYGVTVPIGTNAMCPQHQKADGFNVSGLSINLQTVINIENSGDNRTSWTALSIMERTKYFVELTYDLWRLPKIYCSNPQCSKYQTPINLVKGDLVETNDADTFIGNKKCVEMINGEKCDSELEVFWPRMGLAPDLDVPSENNKPNNGRM